MGKGAQEIAASCGNQRYRHYWSYPCPQKQGCHNGFMGVFRKSITKIPEKLPEPLSEASVTPPAPEEIIPARKYTSPQEAYGVDQHIRNLSGGRHHSAEKAAEAAALGISLSPNQTLVDSYTKCVA